MKNKSSIFTSFLNRLGVKFTYDYAINKYEEHPHKYNMYGLSLLLNSYNIDTKGLQIDKKDLHKLVYPFIAQTQNDLVLVTKISNNKVNYLWNGINLEISQDEFIKQSSGVILLAETSL